MSTTPIDTWAVDLADVTVIYPFHGSEFIMVVIGVVFWLAWHVWQIGHENKEYEADIRDFGDPESLKKAIDDLH